MKQTILSSCLLVALALVPAFACTAAPEDEPEEMTGESEQLLAGCPAARVKLSGRVNKGALLCSGWQSVTAGQRQYIKMVGARSNGKADLYLQRAGTSSWVTSRATSNTSTEIIDWSAPVTDSYRICAYGNGDYDDVRITMDASNPTLCGAPGSAVDFCFGAVGSNCNGVPVTSPCSTRSDALVECQVAVGSQLHDTCCSYNPGGYNCGGSGNPRGWPSDCKAEWDHAQNDVTTTRQFPRVFDASEPSYRPTDMATWTSFATYDARHRGLPMGASIKTPVGKALWNVDAQNGWCTNPTTYDTYWSLQGNYSVCR